MALVHGYVESCWGTFDLGLRSATILGRIPEEQVTSLLAGDESDVQDAVFALLDVVTSVDERAKNMWVQSFMNQGFNHKSIRLLAASGIVNDISAVRGQDCSPLGSPLFLKALVGNISFLNEFLVVGRPPPVQPGLLCT